MNTLWDKLLENIIKEYKTDTSSFLRKRTISKTVHPNCDALAVAYYNEMQKDVFFRETVLPQLKDPSLGRPYQFSKKQDCSPLSIQHVYHLYMIKKHLGVFIPTENVSLIVEIGGGYGNLCRIIKTLGYDNKYIITDLPQMLSIQEDYLSQVGVANVDFHTLDMSQLIPENETEVSILIATFSINEMPIATRKMMEPYYKYYDYLCFVHNTSFDGVDNMKYFNELKLLLQNDFDTEYFKDPHKRSWFMLCKARNR